MTPSKSAYTRLGTQAKLLHGLRRRKIAKPESVDNGDISHPGKEVLNGSKVN